MHIAKKGLRVLGIAESFSGRERSTLAGVVMRRDLVVDGISYAMVTVGGLDATNAIVKMVTDFQRSDINCLMISGCVIAWYNILDAALIQEKLKIPLILVTYEDSEGLENDIRHHFPGDEERLALYRKLGTRTTLDLGTGYRIFIRAWGLSDTDAGKLCDTFTLNGKIPEPLRVARLAARAAMRYSDASSPG